jgi:isoquinoline 1-oxidoreductase alpha subunit
MGFALSVNGMAVEIDAPQDAPLLWILREHLKLPGTHFGCGAGHCGACMLHIDGDRALSCQTQLSEAAGHSIATVEGLSADSGHPVQKAWLQEQVPQCGYCQSGQMMNADAPLSKTPKPTRAEVIEYMSAHICRCGTYARVSRAIERAAGGV